MKRAVVLGGVAVAVSSCASEETKEQRPNVILVVTDDQGLGNLSCMGNQYLSTPAIDNFYEQSVRLVDFHVTPLSTPTRSALITGRYSIRNGAWATFKGRDVISGDTPTIADLFKENGYSTAQFGKWHLGDNYPSRATDSGFEYSVNHRSGGVGELSDYWGNDYFDDVYLVNNRPQQFEGYCTDVWFEQAQKYITEHADSDKPFFIYLATNAPHSPHVAPEEYTNRYTHLAEQNIIRDAGYYGQIANIDDNFARLTQFLDDNGLAENTILVFTTDNGAPPHNNPNTRGYQGAKGSPFEGGHRVPLFIRWCGGGIGGGVDVDGLSSHVDLIPTLASLCGIEVGEEYKSDGRDISAAIKGEGEIADDRSMFIHHRQSQEQPFDVKNSVVMRGDWRLISGEKLYNIREDTAQKHNLAKQKPELVKQLLADNLAFIEETKQREEYKYYIPIVAGNPQQEVVTLTVQHAMGDDSGLWMPQQIVSGVKNRNSRHNIAFDRAGEYLISFARWTRECPGAIWGVPAENPKNQFEYQTIKPERALLAVEPYANTPGSIQKFESAITADTNEVTFKVSVEKGQYILDTQFVEDDKAFGVYYIYVQPVKE